MSTRNMSARVIVLGYFFPSTTSVGTATNNYILVEHKHTRLSVGKKRKNVIQKRPARSWWLMWENFRPNFHVSKETSVGCGIFSVLYGP